jgi:hypothetical protein
VNKLDAVLDTSAIICLLEDEPGADLVEQKIAAAEAGNIKLGGSFVSLTELFYITYLSQGKARAEEFVAVVKSWPMEIIYPDESLCLAAGQIKATQSVTEPAFHPSSGSVRPILPGKTVHAPEFQTFAVIMVAPILSAWAAINKSKGPIGLPALSSVARRSPAVLASCSSKGNTPMSADRNTRNRSAFSLRRSLRATPYQSSYKTTDETAIDAPSDRARRRRSRTLAG